MKFHGKIALPVIMLLLAGCQSGQKGTDKGVASVDPAADRCGASQYQNYLGKPLESVSSLRFSTPVRAIPYNSAVTMDFNLQRLNFLGDSDGKIARVYCG